MAALASTLVRKCLRIRADDDVTIFLYPHNIPLAEEIATECFRVGADVNLSLYTDRFHEAYLQLLSEESLREPSAFCRALAETSTAEFWMGAAFDPALFRRIPPRKLAAASEGESQAHLPAARARRTRSLSVDLGMVTKPRAEAYGLAFDAWERMVERASNADPDALRADGRAVAAVLEGARRVRVSTEEGTDLTLSLHGRTPVVHDGVVDEADREAGALSDRIPAGDVSIPPVETEAEGTVVFGVPTPWAGRSIRQLRWEFSGGRVTAFEGDEHALALREEWEAATGAKDRVATLSVGLNPEAAFGFLQNAIVRGSVSLGIGANDLEGGQNESSFAHVQSLAEATLEVDGRTLVRRGRLVLE